MEIENKNINIKNITEKDLQIIYEKYRISELCKYYRITNYTFNNDMSIDVDGSVWLFKIGLNKLPIKFKKVSGSFNCGRNKLSSLENCPSYVGGDFGCGVNKLYSLKDCPSYVGGSFNCYHNKLASLEFSPNEVGEDYYCEQNKLTSLYGCPEIVRGSFYCKDNKRLDSLEGLGVIEYDIITDPWIDADVYLRNKIISNILT